MYNQEAIQCIIDRIGWSRPIEMTAITMSAPNLTTISGRTFDSYHQLVTVKNVYDTLPDRQMDMVNFNAKLLDFKRQAVLKVFGLIFDINYRAYYKNAGNENLLDVSATDYSELIIRKQSVFDDCYGYQLAIDVLSMQMGSNRSNGNERTIKETQTMIFADLEGVFNEYGKIMVKGIRTKLNDAILRAIDILFPQEIALKGPKIYDRTNRW